MLRAAVSLGGTSRLALRKQFFGRRDCDRSNYNRERMMKYVYVIEKAADGSYSAYVPDLPGCTTCGDTLDEVKRNMRDAVSLYIESLREHGESVPPPTSSVAEVDAAA